MVILQLIFFSFVTEAQVTTSGSSIINSAVPFLNINPGAKSAGMGDASVATLPDIHSQHGNAAKYPFLDSRLGFGISYPYSGWLNPAWLNAIRNDIYLIYLNGFNEIKNGKVISSSFRYFSLGEIILVNQFEESTGILRPKEFAIDLSYSQKLSEIFSGAATIRYIRSDLSGIKMLNLSPENEGVSISGDLAFYLYKESSTRNLKDIFTSGLIIQNIGPKISYNHRKIKDFLPTNLKLGTGYTRTFTNSSYLTLSVELEKFLVPSPFSENFVGDSIGIIGATGITSPKSVISGMFGSFFDAQGGIGEEIREFSLLLGAEYKLTDWVFIRSGYKKEGKDKGHRSYCTFGTGFKLPKMELDLSWLIPTVKGDPMRGTNRISLSFLL